MAIGPRKEPSTDSQMVLIIQKNTQEKKWVKRPPRNCVATVEVKFSHLNSAQGPLIHSQVSNAKNTDQGHKAAHWRALVRA